MNRKKIPLIEYVLIFVLVAIILIAVWNTFLGEVVLEIIDHFNESLQNFELFWEST